MAHRITIFRPDYTHTTTYKIFFNRSFPTQQVEVFQDASKMLEFIKHDPLLYRRPHIHVKHTYFYRSLPISKEEFRNADRGNKIEETENWRGIVWSEKLEQDSLCLKKVQNALQQAIVQNKHDEIDSLESREKNLQKSFPFCSITKIRTFYVPKQEEVNPDNFEKIWRVVAKATITTLGIAFLLFMRNNK